MATVKLYYIKQYEAYRMAEVGHFYSLKPWSGNTIDYKGEDDGGRDYELPDGYSIGETICGELSIFDKNDKYVELITMRQRPVCVMNDTPNPKLLYLKAC